MEPGFVYLMQAEEADGYLPFRPVKIGKSQSPQQRQRDFAGYPSRVKLLHEITTNHMGWLETKLHRQYGGKRLEGEWFDLSENDLRALHQLAVVDRVPDADFYLYAQERAGVADPSPGLWGDVAGEDFGPHPVVEKLRGRLVAAGWRVSEEVVQDLFSCFWRVTSEYKDNVVCTVCFDRVGAWRRAHERAAVVGMLESASRK